MMYESCKVCPDRGTENCALPTPSAEVRLKIRQVGAFVADGMLALGAAMSPGSFDDMPSFRQGVKDERTVLEGLIDYCVFDHSGLDTEK